MGHKDYSSTGTTITNRNQKGTTGTRINIAEDESFCKETVADSTSPLSQGGAILAVYTKDTHANNPIWATRSEWQVSE